MGRLYGIEVKGCHSICLCERTCLVTLIIELLFGTSLLLPAAFCSSTTSLSFPPLLPGAVIAVIFSLLHPRSNLACEIAPFSSTPPPPWSAPLRFPVWVAAITLALSLVRDLGGQHPLRSIVIEMTPHLSPWRQPLHSGVPHPP